VDSTSFTCPINTPCTPFLTHSESVNVSSIMFPKCGHLIIHRFAAHKKMRENLICLLPDWSVQTIHLLLLALNETFTAYLLQNSSFRSTQGIGRRSKKHNIICIYAIGLRINVINKAVNIGTLYRCLKSSSV
jgi:hypothetical protein